MPTTRSPDPAAYEGEDLKPGAPPRPAVEPDGADGSTDGGQTKTDPATGEPTPGRANTSGVS